MPEFLHSFASVRDLDRRAFVKHALLGTVLAALPAPLRGDPYQPWSALGVRGSAVRVRGAVRSGGRGIGGVRVSDGLNVVRTAADGTYELVTSSDRDFVQISVPSGYAIPTNETGTARFYQPIAAGGEMDAVFDLTRAATDDSSHALLLLPDVQTQHDWEMERFHAESVPDLIRTVRDAGDRDVFGAGCGDIMFDDLSLYPEYERGVSRVGVPFFQVVGNHDLDMEEWTDEASTGTFESRFGPRYYSFDRGAVHYVVLDDVFWYGGGYMGYVGDDQMAWLEADLATVESGASVVVLAHIPIFSTASTRNGAERPGLGHSISNRERIYRLLEPFDAHLLSGHTHENEHNWNHGVHEHVSGTVCGAWWSGDICWDGTPNGYAVYEVDGESVTWRYKSTGHPDDHQMRLYRAGADPAARDEFVANVWDADPEWSVVWYENGDRRGPMARRLGMDPRSVREHTGPELPSHRSWVDPVMNNHMFYAPAPEAGATITVEATDRFGRSYTETL